MRSGWANDAIFGLIITFAMSFAVATANAGELFVMPYSCSVVGGRPVLTPSDDHGYTVIGRREQRDFSACSPADPGLCKQWKLYRFDLDCGGTRVPWVSIAAAASADRNGRAWLENGRLHIGMPPRWSMDPDDPCAQPYSDENWWRPGGFARMCADRRAQAHDQIVELPGGYAPMMGLDGIFVAEAAPKADPNSPPSAVQNSSPIKAVHPAQSKKIAVDVQNSATRQVTQPSALRPPKKEIGAPPPPAATALDAHLEVAPKIINQGNSAQNTVSAAATISEADPAPPSATPPLAPSKSAPASDATSALQTASIPTSTVGGPSASQTQPPLHAPTITGSVPETSVSALAGSMDTGVLAAVSLAALGLVALTFFQWRERAQPILAGNRDLAAVSFDGRATGRDIAVAPANGALWVPGIDKQYPGPVDAGRPLPISSEIPQTREQAIQILGMGVAPDVSAAAIKKIVDGLRLSWHPDHAKSVEERQLRELRMKQINAAWDIISGKHFA